MSASEQNKLLTHWLQNPNKNYLGHWDLPNGQDVVLTIASAQWEIVKDPTKFVTDPITNKTKSAEENKRVIRFVEKYKWVKPFICNETNAKMIYKNTGAKYMEESVGKKIKIGVGVTTVKKEEIDCIRVRDIKHNVLNSMIAKINKEQANELIELAKLADKPVADICSAYKIENITELPESRFVTIKSQLEKIIASNNQTN